MDTREQAIIKAVEALSDDVIDLLHKLVAEPSTLGNEASVVNVMEEAFLRLGFDPVRVPIDPHRLDTHPGFANALWDYPQDQGRNNLVAVVKGQNSEARSAMFNGHIDVVSPEPLQYWNENPFSPFVKDGWLYGRGSGDMKGGVAAMVYAAKAVESAGFALQGDLTLETVIEEECSGNGALACLDAGYDADAVLIPEPFGPTILTQEVGVLWFKVDVGGAPSHVLQAQIGANAIEKIFPLIEGLRGLEQEMNEEPYTLGFPDTPHPLNFNAGIIKGGDWPSTVPAFAELHCRMSFYPNESYESACERIVKRIRETAAKDPWLAVNQPKVTFYGFRSKGHILDMGNPALQNLGQIHTELTGEAPREYHCTCTTDLRAFTSFGKGSGTCYGPVARNIHAANECVNIDSVIHTAKAYALYLARWCGLAE